MSDTETATDITMPELSEGMESGTISAWLVGFLRRIKELLEQPLAMSW